MDIERYLLGTALNGVISQRLVKRICQKCRKSRPTNAYEKNLFKKVLNKDVESIYEPVGCDDCFGGYRGRLAVHEVLVLNQAVRDAITNNMRKDDLRRLVYDKKNTFTILEDGLEKVILGLTSLDEVIRITSLEDDFGADDEEIKNAFIGSDLHVTSFTEEEKKQEQEEVKPEDIHKDIIDIL
jgi:type II secretory ATPase GspE/PulE/Tfp pilus assembly ATPase PilB-like protein